MIKKYLPLGIILSWIAVCVTIVSVAHANPIYVAPTVQTATATSSPAYMGIGLATSSLVYDAYANPTSNKYLPTKVAVGFQFVGSSTSAVLNIALEYSNDGIDWYRDTVVDGNSVGTTSPLTNISTTETYQWTYSSTEKIETSTNASATTTRLIVIPTPTRFVRIVESMTGAAGAVWTQIMPIKEIF